MSVCLTIEVLALCDGEVSAGTKCAERGLWHVHTLQEAKAKPLSAGWKVKGRRALCPACAERLRKQIKGEGNHV